MNSRIFSGYVEHARHRPVSHRFRTPVTFYAFDLDELERLDREVKGFGFNRFAPVSLRERDYLSPGDAPPREKLAPWIDGLDLPAPPARILWVTSARWWGKVFNPVSFYVLFDPEDRPAGMVAEVNNTFGDRHVYAVRLEPKEGLHEAEHDKEFHVSPFNDMRGRYRFTLRRTGDELYIGVDLYRDGEKILDAWIEGTGAPLTSASLRRVNLRHPLRPWLTVPRIAWQAMFLKFKHKLPVFTRPVPDHPHTILSRENRS